MKVIIEKQTIEHPSPDWSDPEEKKVELSKKDDEIILEINDERFIIPIEAFCGIL